MLGDEPSFADLSQTLVMKCSSFSLSFLLFLFIFISNSAPLAAQTAMERSLERQGMVRLHSIDSTIHVSLMYSRADNFMGRRLYTDLTTAYLHPEAAKALAKAQRALKRWRPDLSLIVFDAVRPIRIQQLMYDRVKNTPQAIYVSNPARGGGLHNYGLAVDLSLCTATGDTLDMGTVIDHLGTAAHTDQEAALVRAGRISPQAVRNRALLRKAMAAGGFRVLRTEWWHFNLKSRAEAKRHYRLIH